MIHQFVPMLHLRDAVGRHTLGVQAELERRGVESRIYVELEDPETADRTRDVATYPFEARPGDILVYQFATASDMAGWLSQRGEPLVVNYHNITPASCFAPWDNGLARHQVRAKSELTLLAASARAGVAVSEFNRRDLEAAGYRETAVVPPIVPGLEGRTDRREPEGPRPRLRSGRWLAVGRVAPNKAVEDAMAALFAYRMRHDPQAELQVIGRPAIPAYSRALQHYAATLGVADAVHFDTKVSDEGLAAAYRSADVLVVTSEHEGFCLPVVEAMAHRLPVVAFRAGALAEVLGDAGVLVDTKDPMVLADTVRRLQVDPAWRTQVVEAGSARLPMIGLEQAASRLVDLIQAAG